MDEANFIDSDVDNITTTKQLEFNKASRLYTSSRQRARSRFLRYGIDHSLSILVSSSTHQSSFTESRKVKSLNDPHAKLITARLWDVKEKGTYSKEVFYVFTGSDLMEPYIINTIADLNQYAESIQYPPFTEDMTPEQAINSLPPYVSYPLPGYTRIF